MLHLLHQRLLAQTPESDGPAADSRAAHAQRNAALPDAADTLPNLNGVAKRRLQRRRQFEAGKSVAETALTHAQLTDTHTLVRDDERWEIHGPSAAWVSVSHSGEWVVCALSSQGAIGVDVESLARPLRDLEAWSEYIDAGLYAAIRSLPEASQAAALVRCWTLLEALGKLRQTPLLQSAGFPLIDARGDISLTSWSTGYHCYGREVGAEHFLGLVSPTISAADCERLGVRALLTMHDLSSPHLSAPPPL